MEKYLVIKITVDDETEEGKETVLEFFKTFPTTATAIEATRPIMAALEENRKELVAIMEHIEHGTKDYHSTLLLLKRYLGGLLISLGSNKKAKLPYPVSPNCFCNLEKMGFDLDTIAQEEFARCTKMCLAAHRLRSVANWIDEETTWSLRDGNLAILDEEIEELDGAFEGIFIEITLDYDGTPWIIFDDAIQCYGDLSSWVAEDLDEVKDKVYLVDSVRRYLSEMSEPIWERFLDDWKAKEDGGYEFLGCSKEKIYIGDRW